MSVNYSKTIKIYNYILVRFSLIITPNIVLSNIVNWRNFMDVKYINPFITAFTNTLEQLTLTNVQRSGIRKKSKMLVDSGVSTVISIQGEIQGNMALCMPEDTAKKLVSTMMMGMEVSTLDDMAKSAIGEILSMIGGNATSLLASSKITLQISPPTVLTSPSEINGYETIVFEFESPVGKLEFNIGFI
jgi:chemotaxis protein CheX